MVTITDDNNNVTTYYYNKNGEPNLIVDANGNGTSYEYNERGLNTKITHPDGNETTYTYTLSGKVDSTTDPNGNTTIYEYDSFDRVETITDAEGNYRINTYDKLDRVIRQTACNSGDVPLMQTRTEYDELGRAIRQAVMADAASTSAINTSVDMVTDSNYAGTYGWLVDETAYYNGGTPAVTRYYHDTAGRMTAITDPAGNETIFTLDESGRVTRRQQIDYDPLGSNDVNVITDYEYDPLGRVIRQTTKPVLTEPDTWQTTEFEYNALGNRTKVTKANGVIIKYSYDGLGRLKEKIADYGGGKINQKTEYGYDELGRQKTITGYADGNTAQTTTYTYNSLGRVTNILYPDGNGIDFVYNAAGRVIKRTDQRGIITTYSYDDTYNLLAKAVDGESVTDDAEETFTYDGLGRMLTADKTVNSTTVSQIELAYNDLGAITDANETLFGGTKRETNYTSNQAGSLASITYPDGTSVVITPEVMGRIDTLDVDSTTIATYKYTGPLVAERKYPAPATDIIYRPNYDNLGRITAGNTYQGAADILKFSYDYEPNTYNISRIKFDHRPSDPCNEFSYDNLDRLIMAEYGVDETNESFTMDDLGNRDSVNLKGGSSEDYVIDSMTNRYISVGGDNLAYDRAGNLAKDKDGYEYEYDYENRITRVKKNGSTTVAEFAYDAIGRRIRKTDSIADTNTLYYYGSGWQVLAEYNGAGTLQRRFVYGNYIDEPLLMNDGSNDYYYTQDHLYSSAALLDNNGDVVERYEYDAYGQPYILTPQYAPRSTSQYGNLYMFTGREVDFLDNGNLKLQYNRNRYYGYYIGRWFSYDPIGYGDNLNLFEYAGSNPVMRVDPSGEKWKITRRGQQTAEAEVVEKSDTISQLAEMIRLDKDEFKKWLQVAGKINDKSLNELKADDQICVGEKVEIPNFVIAYWGGEFDGFGKVWVEWGSDVSALKKRGFYVHEIENYTAADLESVIDSFMATRKLFGIFAWGHGSPAGALLTVASKKNDGAYYSNYANWNPEYKMGLGVIFACNSQTAKDFFSSNAIFWGKTGTLVPWPGHAFGPRISELIPEGF